ncbi:MAG: regulatory iron-sulfur-containing complex subunit RicT [Elusimicrobiota bacterium]|nr:regulatory iron-sulfur-containing complex subunit RicT [Elusimicrobiota bacterium]
MLATVRVRLMRDKSTEVYLCGEVSPSQGDRVLVKTEYGKEAGVCLSSPVSASDSRKKAPRLIKKMAAEDFKKLKRITSDEKSAFKTVSDLVAAHETPLKLAKVCYTFEKRRVFVYYTANSRVDFRALIKDINARLHTHVQMVQVSGVECARIIGGLGVCGRPFCCTLFGKGRGRAPRGTDQKSVGPCGKTLCCHQIRE